MKKTTQTIALIAMLSTGAFAGTLTITGQTQNVDEGGQFSAYLSSDPAQQLMIYCVDFQNYEQPVSTVNVTDLANLAEVTINTRYGQTSPGGFSTQTSPWWIGDAQDRYTMAAWLISQYDFTNGVTTADDQIQNAIWTLLDTDGTSGFPGGDSVGVGAYLTDAEQWLRGETLPELLAFQNTVVIFSSTDIAATFGDARYTTGTQEMIGLVTPESSTLLLCSGGLLLTALISRWRARR